MDDKITFQQLDPINETDLSIFLDCEIVDSSGNSVPLNDVSVVISVFDTTQNFIMQKLINGIDFKFNFNSQEQLLNYLYHEILDIDGNEDLNPGVYRLRFSFILDTFDSVDNEENRFIVTEISPDRTEIRLNPLSNGQSFIDTFTRIRDYQRTAKRLEPTTAGFAEFYRDYVNSVFSEQSINNIFSDSEVIVDGQLFSKYLERVYYSRSNISNTAEREADAEEKALDAIEEMKSLLRSKKGDAVVVASQHFEEARADLFDKLRNTPEEDTQKRNTVLNEYKLGLRDRIQEFLEDAIDEVVDLVLINTIETQGNDELPTQEDIDNLLDPVDDDPGGGGVGGEESEPVLVVDSSDDTDSTTSDGSTTSGGTTTGGGGGGSFTEDDEDRFNRDLQQFQVR